ncbi:response regulator transcription factor [Acidothermaceae bacterium B102]|nr:response regulator transcription factor [Acidothermaceae bacterium B102]
MTDGPITVVVADDQAMVRGGFRALLDAESDLSVVAEAADGQQALEQARAFSPDVLIMDIRMPVLDGLQATRQIVDDASLRRTRVLVVTTFDLDEYVFGALAAGASGFLLKGMEPGELISAVRVIAAGDALLAPTATRRLIAAYSERARPRAVPVALAPDTTEREREVLALLAEGLSNVEIAARLFISPFTVKSHVSRLLSKHLLRDRVQLVVLAYESGLVRPGG